MIRWINAGKNWSLIIFILYVKISNYQINDIFDRQRAPTAQEKRGGSSAPQRARKPVALCDGKRTLVTECLLSPAVKNHENDTSFLKQRMRYTFDADAKDESACPEQIIVTNIIGKR